MPVSTTFMMSQVAVEVQQYNIKAVLVWREDTGSMEFRNLPGPIVVSLVPYKTGPFGFLNFVESCVLMS